MFSSDHSFNYEPQILIWSVCTVVFCEFCNVGFYSPAIQALLGPYVFDGRSLFVLLICFTHIALWSESVLCNIPTPWNSILFSTRGPLLLTFRVCLMCICVDDHERVSHVVPRTPPHWLCHSRLLHSNSCLHPSIQPGPGLLSQRLPLLCKSPWISCSFCFLKVAVSLFGKWIFIIIITSLWVVTLAGTRVLPCHVQCFASGILLGLMEVFLTSFLFPMT